jgi:alkylated DNA repair protein (DNA oxidative demethylase)
MDVARSAPIKLRDMRVYPGLLDHQAQLEIVEDLREVLKTVPLFRPVTPGGKPMSVRMSAAGAYGWITDSSGYRYARTHPNGATWPAIPKAILDVWQAVSGSHRAPECCLINFYDDTARMGMHQDKDEADFDQPVVSISLGDDARFRIGNDTRGGTTESIWFRSGDVAVMGGAARLRYHGVDKVAPGTSTLLPKGGRINLTLRVVT